ncbi:MAG: hypothetical protein PUA56_05550 [Bacillales bacterium]|nr:hypothetical protein [Bacillales bacterium]
MDLILNNVILFLDENEDRLIYKAAKQLKVNASIINNLQIIKKAVDARKKDHIIFVYSLKISLNKEYDFSWNKNVRKVDYVEEIQINKIHSKYRPIIIGFGPSGMFAGLYLARAGMNPIIYERGKCIEEREIDVEKFKSSGIFNSSSNVCFGEGGAGTFSDGKLTTGIKDKRIRFVINELIKHGAPKEISYEAHPHIGSDYLKIVVKNIRKEIISLGGEIFFNHTFLEYTSVDGKIDNVIIKDDKQRVFSVKTDDLILSIGHSARDTFKMLYNKGILINPKPFSVGVRIEMKQEELDKGQYGKEYKNPKLKRAEYKIVEHLSNGRCVYSFCMCPGGEVVASNTEENSILVNGMSYFKRDMENANSALLVSVNVDDYYKSSPLDGMYFQEELEKKAFNIDYPYFAPVQLVGDFLNNRISTHIGSVKPSYKPGFYFARLDDILPSFITNSLRDGLNHMGKRLKPLVNKDNVLTGVETRSSSPITIPRDDNGNSSVLGIYPCGEGAGYAGGIMSAAIDGLRICECIERKYNGGK